MEVLGPLRPGRAVDLAAGAGRHALWLAARGWRVTAVDFAPAGAERGLAAAAARGLAVDWVVADVRGWAPAGDVLPLDLVLAARVRLDPGVLRAAGEWLAPGGLLVLLGHSRPSPGGRPRDPALLHTPRSMRDSAPGLQVERLEALERPGGGEDLLLVARRGLARPVGP